METSIMTFSDYRGTFKALYLAITKDINDIFAKNKKTETNATGECDCWECPIIQDADDDDEKYVLDWVGVDKFGIYIKASNSYETQMFRADEIPLEKLLEVLEVLKEYENELFKDLEEVEE
jgi:hypothetical protein